MTASDVAPPAVFTSSATGANVNDTSVAAVINDSWYVSWISVDRVP